MYCLLDSLNVKPHHEIPPHCMCSPWLNTSLRFLSESQPRVRAIAAAPLHERQQQVEVAGVDAVRAGAYENLQEVHLCAFTAEEQQTLINLCKSKFQEELGQHFVERAFVFVRTAA